mgnify:CR=1 FL=1
MTLKSHHKAIIATVLIIGTLLALYLTITVGYDMFWIHVTWMYRDGLIQKIACVGLYAIIPLAFIDGLICTISFLKKGHIGRR